MVAFVMHAGTNLQKKVTIQSIRQKKQDLSKDLFVTLTNMTCVQQFQWQIALFLWKLFNHVFQPLTVYLYQAVFLCAVYTNLSYTTFSQMQSVWFVVSFWLIVEGMHVQIWILTMHICN